MFDFIPIVPNFSLLTFLSTSEIQDIAFMLMFYFSEVQPALEQYRSELNRSIYTQIFFSVNILKKNLEMYRNLKNFVGESHSLEILRN